MTKITNTQGLRELARRVSETTETALSAAAPISPSDRMDGVPDNYSDTRELAVSIRLHRLADAHLHEVINEHVLQIHSVGTADMAVDTYDDEYLLGLSVSYRGLAQLCQLLITAVRKYNVEPSKTWVQFANEDFPYEQEIEESALNLD